MFWTVRAILLKDTVNSRPPALLTAVLMLSAPFLTIFMGTVA